MQCIYAPHSLATCISFIQSRLDCVVYGTSNTNLYDHAIYSEFKIPPLEERHRTNHNVGYEWCHGLHSFLIIPAINVASQWLKWKIRCGGGGAENAGVENAGLENALSNRRGGKCRTAKCRNRKIWKTMRIKYSVDSVWLPQFPGVRTNNLEHTPTEYAKRRHNGTVKA